MGICIPAKDLEPFTKVPANPLEYYQQAERCVHRWAYKLGPSPGSNEEIAQASVGSCESEIGLVAASYRDPSDLLREPKTRADQFAIERRDTAQVAMNEANEKEFQASALIWVIQGRAGRCSEEFGKSL